MINFVFPKVDFVEIFVLKFLGSVGLRNNLFSGSIPDELCEVHRDILVVDMNMECKENCKCLSDYNRTMKSLDR